MLRTIGTVCLAAGVAIGCNHENVRAERAEQAQEQQRLAREQEQEQRELERQRAELQREQQQERAELRQDQAEERQEDRAEAREDLIEKTNEIGENHEELSEDVRDLNALVMQACATVPEPDRKTCPLSSERVVAVNNVTDGVRIKLDAFAGPKATIEERVGCYRARAEIQHSMARLAAKGAPTPERPSCVLDQPELDMEVTENDGQVALELTTDGQASVRELRAQARALLDSGPQANVTTAHVNGNVNANGNANGNVAR